MINLSNRLIENDLTRDELINRVEIRKTNENDLFAICKTLAKAFDLTSEIEALMQLTHSHALLNESIKLVDKDNGDIYGLLMFCEYPINVGSPIEMIEKPISDFLKEYKQVNGHSFIIDERLRNCGLDKKMLLFNYDYLLGNYDLMWIGVEIDLRSHAYWKRLGFAEIFKINEAIFYVLPLGKTFIEDIYRNKNPTNEEGNA